MYNVRLFNPGIQNRLQDTVVNAFPTMTGEPISVASTAAVHFGSPSSVNKAVNNL